MDFASHFSHSFLAIEGMGREGEGGGEHVNYKHGQSIIRALSTPVSTNLLDSWMIVS